MNNYLEIVALSMIIIAILNHTQDGFASRFNKAVNWILISTLLLLVLNQNSMLHNVFGGMLASTMSEEFVAVLVVIAILELAVFRTFELKRLAWWVFATLLFQSLFVHNAYAAVATDVESANPMIPLAMMVAIPFLLFGRMSKYINIAVAVLVPVFLFGSAGASQQYVPVDKYGYRVYTAPSYQLVEPGVLQPVDKYGYPKYEFSIRNTKEPEIEYPKDIKLKSTDK